MKKTFNQEINLKITSKNKSIVIGSFLRHEEKIDVVKSLEKALKKYHFNYAQVNVAN